MIAAVSHTSPLARKVQAAEMTREAPDKKTLPPLLQDRKRIVSLLADDGYTAEAIGDRLGMSKKAVNNLAKKMGISIGRRGGTRRIGAFVPRRHFHVVERLAADAGISRSAMIERIVKAVCEDEASAKKFLGKDAMPTRRYGERG